MNAFERFFHGPFGASRAYLFARAFLLLLALDTFVLMIGHAGRYGVAGFNVAHFAWLDALQPTPTAASYIAVLLLVGLLALVLALSGLSRPGLAALFALYTFSWSMSMLDSYQHHYFVSLVLLCLVFFPRTSAAEIHPLPEAVAPDQAKGKRKLEGERAQHAERRGWLYAGSLVLICATYAVLTSSEHVLSAFLLFAAALGLATYLYRPTPRAGGPLFTSGFGFNLLGVSVAIVYTYTAIAKTDANWLAGHTLLRISSVEQLFAGLAEYAERLGLPRDRFFALLSSAVVPQELGLALCYVLAVHPARERSKLLRALCLLGFALSVVLHVGAEAMKLEIGWFSYYMLLFGSCYLLPLAVVDRLVTLFTWPARFLSERVKEWQRESPLAPLPALAIALGCAALLVMVGYLLDLPGAIAATAIAGAAVVTLSAFALRGTGRFDPRPIAVASACAAACLWGAIASTSVRFDYYRYLGGDQSRRGELEAALETYRRGERYAKPGQSRASKIADLERRLGRRN